MEHDGTVTVPADRATVWETVTDPEVLTACVMGAEEVRRVSDRTYEGASTAVTRGSGDSGECRHGPARTGRRIFITAANMIAKSQWSNERPLR